MKGFAVAFLVSGALSTICAGKAFDEKQSAIKEIDSRFAETVRLRESIVASAESEKKGINTRGESELLAQLTIKINDTRCQLEKDAKTILQTAIIKAKPVSVVHCIRKVTASGNNKIDVAYDESWEKVVAIRLIKIEKLDFDIYAVNAIIEGLKELIEQTKSKIQNDVGILSVNKKEALNNCNSADLLLGEIEVNLHEPILSREYIKMRQEIDRKLSLLRSALNAELEKCLGSNTLKQD